MTRSQAAIVGAVRVVDAAFSAAWSLLATVADDDEELHQRMHTARETWKRLYDYVAKSSNSNW